MKSFTIEVIYGKIRAVTSRSRGLPGGNHAVQITPSACCSYAAALKSGALMQNDWLFIGIFLLMAPVFPALALVIPRLIAPRKPNPLKSQTYECGIETYGDTWVQFKAQYYIFALAFLIFDVEVVFLYPWAVAFDQIPLFAVFEGVIFILILVVGLVYAWRKGILEWV
jgi:NADH-quinone oxidoreductase subunit A